MENKDVKRENASNVEGDHPHNAMSSSFTTQRPGSFLFKIESFSLLRDTYAKSNHDKLDSWHFRNEGYDWKLSVYPNGDKQRGGDGYISLYLELASSVYLLQDGEVRLFFKFFVFDYLRDTYLVFQDGKERRFHALNTDWGFAKLLPLEIFNDPSQGYLVDDRCAFGVEMFIHKKASKLGLTLSIKNSLASYDRTFTWTWKIDKFSKLPELRKSRVFSAGGRKWCLHLHPKGDSRAKGTSLSLFLVLEDQPWLPSGWNIYAVSTLRILDQLNKKHHERGNVQCFSAATGSCWGHSQFMQLSDLKSESRGFIVKDTAVIQVEFTSIFSSSG